MKLLLRGDLSRKNLEGQRGRAQARYEAGLQPAEDLARALSRAFNPGWYETGRWPEAIYNSCTGRDYTGAVMTPMSLILARAL